MTTSAVVIDVPTDEQELPEPVRLRAESEIRCARRVGEAETHPTSTNHVNGPTHKLKRAGETEGKAFE